MLNPPGKGEEQLQSYIPLMRQCFQNSDVESENIVQAFGSPVRTKCQSYHSLTHSNTQNTRTQAPSSDNHVEMSPVSFSDIAYTSVVSRVAVTITNTSKSKTISNMRLSTSNSKLLWFEFMSEYSSDEDDDNDEEEDEEIDDENGDKDTQRPQRTKSNEEELIAIKHDDDPERSELIGTDADAYVVFEREARAYK